MGVQEKEDNIRKSKDGIRNGEGRKLVALIEEEGLEILNGNIERDVEYM